jgi:ribosomal protein S18 acetylase RimI-like enzyme
MLVSNTRLAPALRLYRKCGFVEVPMEPGIEYARADIQMELDLRPRRPG